ncbi:alpha/beta hydrolase family protein [Macrococcus sp. EM39E]|uniref:alpha/beta hydrolase family protein n=1 Tax=Macrococcus animalis TaxID=3395467 RepID=UPI0039BEDA36
MFINKKSIQATYQGIVFKEVTYQSDEFEVKGLLYEPQNVDRIVIYLRGGKGQVGILRPAGLMRFAYSNTLVAAPYYRGTHQNGQDEFGGADQEDVYALVRILREQYPKVPLHFIGFSRGGIQGLVTYQASKVTSFITWGGVSSIYYMYNERQDLRGMLKRIIGPITNKVEYDKREGLALIKADSPPIMIIHGTADKQVNVAHGKMLEERLISLGVYHKVIYIQNEAHVLRPDNERMILEEIYEWMKDVES